MGDWLHDEHGIMIVLWRVRYPSSVHRDSNFKIQISTLYLTFPFTTIFIRVIKGTDRKRIEKNILFPLGIFAVTYEDSIDNTTTYNIECGKNV